MVRHDGRLKPPFVKATSKGTGGAGVPPAPSRGSAGSAAKTGLVTTVGPTSESDIGFDHPDPFENYVPPAMLPLDDVALGHGTSLEDSGWIEAGVPASRTTSTQVAESPQPPSASPSRSMPPPSPTLSPVGHPDAESPSQAARVMQGLVRAGSRLSPSSVWRFIGNLGLAEKLMLVLAIAMILGLVAVYLVVDPGGSTAKPHVQPEMKPAPPADGQSLLFMVSDSQGHPNSFTLFVHQDRSDQVVSLPGSLLAEVPTRGVVPLSRGGDDPSLLSLAVANSLRVRVDRWISMSSSDFQSILGQLEPLVVDVSHPVIIGSTPGTGTPLPLASGKQEMTAATVMQYLAATSSGGELARMAQQGDVWKAVLAVLGQSPSRMRYLLAGNSHISASGQDGPGAAAILANVATASQDVSYSAAPVRVGPTIGDQVTFEIDSGELTRFGSEFPKRMVLAQNRTSVELVGDNRRRISSLAVRIDQSQFKVVASASQVPSTAVPGAVAPPPGPGQTPAAGAVPLIVVNDTSRYTDAKALAHSLGGANIVPGASGPTTINGLTPDLSVHVGTG